jgi:hypothetical protein
MAERKVVGVSAAVAVVLLMFPLVAGAATEPPALRPLTAATLTVLSGPVEHARATGGTLARAASGSDLAEGDRVVTAPSGRALITFLDGTTVTVEPGSDITVREAGPGDRGASRVRILILSGTVWARVAGWLGGRGTVTLQSNTNSATARDGLIGAEARPDGSFVSWTRAGDVELRDAGGTLRLLLRAGEKGTLAYDGTETTEPFSVNASTLEVVVAGPVLPLLIMPDGVRAAGFVPPGIEVNQVFGSFTEERDGRHVVEVPAGAAGPYRLVITAVGDGDYTVSVVGRFKGKPVYWEERRGRLREGEQRGADIVQRFGEFERPEPRAARVVDGWLGRLRSVTAGIPTTIVLSPDELAMRAAR